MEPIALPDIFLITGAAWDDELQLYEDAAQTLPVDLTGRTFVTEIRREPRSSSPLLATMQFSISAPLTGVIKRHIHAVDSAAMPTGIACYDTVENSGERAVWFTGRIIVKPGVTV